jgi:transposase
LLPQAPLGKAFGYALRHWEALVRYTENGVLLPDNNALERQIRPIAIGRETFYLPAQIQPANAPLQCTA